MTSDITDPSNIINFFVAFGTCSAVAVALLAKGQSSFENTFNILLAQHNDTLRKLKEHKDYNKKINEIFSLKENYNLKELNKNMHNLDDFYGSYFRILYHILKHIDRNAGYYRFDHKNKKRYSSLIRSFLDNETTLLLAINCAHAKPGDQYYNYKCLIERYAFLEHLILDPGKFHDYIKYNSSDLTHAFTLICQTNNMFHKTLTSEIFKTYHLTAFGKHDYLKKIIQNNM